MFIQIFQSELRWTDSLNFFWPFWLNNTHLGVVWTIPYLHNLSVNFVYRSQLKMMTYGHMGGYRWFRRECWLVPSPLLMSLPTSAGGVMGRRKAREDLLPSYHPQLPPCVTREVEQFFFFLKEIQHFRFSKVFSTLQQWPVHRANVNVIKHWNRDEVFVPCHQQNKGESD